MFLNDVSAFGGEKSGGRGQKLIFADMGEDGCGSKTDTLTLHNEPKATILSKKQQI